MFNLPKEVQRWAITLCAVCATSAIVDAIWLRPREITLFNYKFSGSPLPESKPAERAPVVQQQAYKITSNSVWWGDLNLDVAGCMQAIEAKVTEARATNAAVGVGSKVDNLGS